MFFYIFDCFYFSLVTQTTVGYGDIIPHTRFMRIINIFQMFSIYGIIATSIF